MTNRLTTTALALVLSAGVASAQELTVLIDNNAANVSAFEALIAAY